MEQEKQYLIRVTDFIVKLSELLKQDEISYKEFTYKVVEYICFITQNITLGQFIPCDLEGNVLEKPERNNYLSARMFEEKIKEYQEAQNRVILKSDLVYLPRTREQFLSWVNYNKFKTLEDLTHLNLELIKN